MACEMYPELKEDLTFAFIGRDASFLTERSLPREMNGTPEEKELVSYIRAHFESVKNNKQMTKSPLCVVKGAYVEFAIVSVRAARYEIKSPVLDQ